MTRLARLVEQTGSQVNALAAATGQLGVQLDRFSEARGIDELRATLASIEDSVGRLAEAQRDEDAAGPVIETLGAQLTALAEVTLPARLRDMDLAVAGVVEGGRQEWSGLRAGLDELNGTVAALARREAQEQVALGAGLDELDRAVTALARQGARERVALDVGLDTFNDNVAALAGDHAVPTTAPAIARGRPGRRPSTAMTAPAWLLALTALPIALVIWQVGLGQVVVRDMSDTGLTSVLPVSFWLALWLLALGFCLAVYQTPLNRALVLGYLVALVVIIHGTPAILYATLRYSWAWKHAGIVEYVTRHGPLHPNARDPLSGYRAWAGFYALNARITQASGVASSLSYASWAPPVFSVAILGPLAMIVRAFTADRRLLWTTLWVFTLANWVGQDYFSPQAFNYFLYLTALAICLRLFDRQDSSRVRLALTGILVILLAMIATIDPLTPFALIAALVVLAVFRRSASWVFPVIMLLFTGAWLATGASPFLGDSFHSILSAIGRPDSVPNANFTHLVKASSGRAQVVLVGRALSVAILGLAAVGRWGRRSHLRREAPLMLLVLSPLPLIVAAGNGGQVISRVYLFSLPFAAFFAASAVLGAGSAMHMARSRGPLVLASVSFVLLAGLAVSYYGYEQTNYFSPAEVTASHWLSDHAPPGSLIVAATDNLPWFSSHSDAYDYEWFALADLRSRRAILADPAGALGSIMAPDKHKAAYLILTRSQAAQIDATGLMPPGWLEQMLRALQQSGRFGIAFKSDDAVVLSMATA